MTINIKNIPTSEINAFIETVTFNDIVDSIRICKRIREHALEDFASEVFTSIIEDLGVKKCMFNLNFHARDESYDQLVYLSGMYATFCKEFGPIEHQASTKLKAVHTIFNYLTTKDKGQWLSDKGINRMTISRLAARNGIDLKDFSYWIEKSSRSTFAELFEAKGIVCNQDPKRKFQSFTYDEKEDWTQSTFEIKGITPELAKEIKALLIGTIKFTTNRH